MKIAIKLTPVVACLVVGLSGVCSVRASTPITTITLDNAATPFTTTANVTSVTVGSSLISEANFTYASTITQVTSGPGGLFYGTGESSNPPAGMTLAGNLAGANLIRGTTNPTQPIDVFFASDLNTVDGTPYVFVFEVNGTGGASEGWTVQAILGGTPSSPMLGGTAFNFVTAQFGDTGRDLIFRRNSSENLTQNVLGIAIGFSDLGLLPTDELLGVRVTSTSGDPAAIFGGTFNVPEPTRATLLGLGAAFLIFTRRRVRKQSLRFA